MIFSKAFVKGVFCGFLFLSLISPRLGKTDTLVAPSKQMNKIDSKASPADKPQTAQNTVPAISMGKDLVNQTLSLSPDDIKYLKRELYKRKKAAQSPPEPPPRPITRTLLIDLSPGAAPPVIRVAERNGASLIFTDSTGAVWPILTVNNFAQDVFDVLVPVKNGGVLNIAAKGAYGQGNLAVFLKDLNVPIIFCLYAGQKETDFRVDVRLPRRGPNAKAITISTPQAPEFDQWLIDILSDTPPITAQKVSLKFENSENPINDTKAWIIGENLYIRTPYSPISPGIKGYLSSNDGMTAYKLNKTSLILLSVKGEIYKVRVIL